MDRIVFAFFPSNFFFTYFQLHPVIIIMTAPQRTQPRARAEITPSTASTLALDNAAHVTRSITRQLSSQPENNDVLVADSQPQLDDRGLQLNAQVNDLLTEHRELQNRQLEQKVRRLEDAITEMKASMAEKTTSSTLRGAVGAGVISAETDGMEPRFLPLTTRYPAINPEYFRHIATENSCQKIY